MCGKLSFFLFVFFLLCLSTAALRAVEQDKWYLISETELSAIEQYKTKSEAEKQNWLLQAQKSKIQSENLLKESETLNSQLAVQRDLNRKLQQSFNELETEWLNRLSLKNGEIAGLKQAVSEKILEAEKYKGKAALRLVVIIALAAAIAGYALIRILRFFKIITV